MFSMLVSPAKNSIGITTEFCNNRGTVGVLGGVGGRPEEGPDSRAWRSARCSCAETLGAGAPGDGAYELRVNRDAPGGGAPSRLLFPLHRASSLPVRAKSGSHGHRCG